MATETLNDKNINTGKLSFTTKAGYGAAAAADTIGPGIVGSYFMWYLTDIAGIDPVFAGTITLLAVLWDGITDPLIGYLSDNCRSRFGRRRPFIFLGGILMAIGMFMMFSTVGFESIALKAYYVFSAMMYYLGYTMFNIPYYAMAGEMTADGNERVQLRASATVFINIGQLFSGTLPVLIVAYLQGKGAAEGDAWHYTITLMAIIAFIFMMVTCKTIKGKESIDIVEEIKEGEKENFFKSILQVLKIRSYRVIILASICFYSVFTLFWAALWYFMTSNLQLSAVQTSSIYTINLIGALIILAIITVTCKKIDKKEVFTVCLLLGGGCLCVLGIIGISTYIGCAICVIFYTLAATSYWTLVYPLFYEIYEVDELVHSKRREGIMFSWFSFIDKAAAAITIQLLGFALSMNNYDGAVVQQVPEALKTILYATTLAPGILTIICGIIIIKFPINKHTYKIILTNLELKKAGKEYSTKGLEKIV